MYTFTIMNTHSQIESMPTDYNIHQLPPEQLSSDSTLSGWTLYPEQSGGLYLLPHHMNGEQNDYQSDSEEIQDAYYAPALTETPRHSDLSPADVAISYWPTEQSISHGDLAKSYSGERYPDVLPLAAITTPSQETAVPAFTSLLTFAPYRSDLRPQDVMAHSALCKGAATFQTTDTSYAHLGPCDSAASVEECPQYATAFTQEQQPPYEAVYTPAAQDHTTPPALEVPSVPEQAPSPSLPVRQTKRKASSLSRNISRGRSPMGHLPYDDIAKVRKSRRSPAFNFEPKGDGHGSDWGKHDDDEDNSLRHERHGKKPKTESFFACYFCRGRKIACHPEDDRGDDRTCTPPPYRLHPRLFSLSVRSIKLIGLMGIGNAQSATSNASIRIPHIVVSTSPKFLIGLVKSADPEECNGAASSIRGGAYMWEKRDDAGSYY
ncbi:hypothetical protein EI94DRAFT_1702081 [Lactarius quietus]|nr:hypothetical protein EI94DRAFT_1702081 [Lactarius quietus]